MAHLKVTDKHLDFFNSTVKKHKAGTNFPRKDNWKKSDNNDLWNDMVIQVMVVGGSDGAERYSDIPKIQRLIKFDSLVKVNDYNKVAKAINYVLREAGVRYASADMKKCIKTKALVHNFKILKGTKNGFKGILERISEFYGQNADIRKVKYLMKIFRYIKSKSARDFLMGQGICTNTIAIDIRIQNIFKSINLTIPDAVLSSPTIYDQVEKEIVTEICSPIKIEPMKFDRILYQNYDSILDN